MNKNICGECGAVIEVPICKVDTTLCRACNTHCGCY